jgi:hypothetical protein
MIEVRRVEPDFLDADEVDCPVIGCNWRGEQLGNHGYIAHGLLAREFKQLLGVPIGCALIGAKLRAKFADRHLPQAETLHMYWDREAVLNAAKVKGRYRPSLLVKERRPIEREEVTCVECARPFSATKRARFCSTLCRGRFYIKQRPTTVFCCVVCGTEFQRAVFPGERRRVACSLHCRQVLNGKCKRKKADKK